MKTVACSPRRRTHLLSPQALGEGAEEEWQNTPKQLPIENVCRPGNSASVSPSQHVFVCCFCYTQVPPRPLSPIFCHLFTHSGKFSFIPSLDTSQDFYCFDTHFLFSSVVLLTLRFELQVFSRFLFPILWWLSVSFNVPYVSLSPSQENHHDRLSMQWSVFPSHSCFFSEMNLKEWW